MADPIAGQLTVVMCNTPYGAGGLGQHLAQVVADERRDGGMCVYYARSIAPGDAAGIVVADGRTLRRAAKLPGPIARRLRSRFQARAFDRAVSANLVAGDRLVAFAGHGFQTLSRARELAYGHRILESPTCHVDKVWAQHAKASTAHAFEDPWLTDGERRLALREYETADVIMVGSEYSRLSFLERGFPPEKVGRRLLTTASRFAPGGARGLDDTFRVVNVGALTVAKGVPVLVEAFQALNYSRAELLLIGGWSSRGMRRYLTDIVRRDRRIHICPGDPLPHLRGASVYVHPSYQDGWGYAPAEAMACGVPVIVTEDTGMKELISEGQNGFVVPTGSSDAIVAALDGVRNGACSELRCAQRPYATSRCLQDASQAEFRGADVQAALPSACCRERRAR